MLMLMLFSSNNANMIPLWNPAMTTLLTLTFLPYSHEHSLEWDRLCVQCVQLLSRTNHRLAPSLPHRTVWVFLHAPDKPLGHSCFSPPWRIHGTSSALCLQLSDPGSHSASTEASSVNSVNCFASSSCLADRLYRIGDRTWRPLADWEYTHKLDKKGHRQDECVWWSFFFTGFDDEAVPEAPPTTLKANVILTPEISVNTSAAKRVSCVMLHHVVLSLHIAHSQINTTPWNKINWLCIEEIISDKSQRPHQIEAK